MKPDVLTWFRRVRVGGTEHLASGEDNLGALPHHGNDRAGGEVVDEAAEERLLGQVCRNVRRFTLTSDKP